MIAFMVRLSGLRDIANRCGHLLGTQNFSSISHALRRLSSMEFVKQMVEQLETSHAPGDGELVALDGMAITLPKTQRHNCKKYNKRTVGGGVVWAYMINVAKGITPIKIIKIVEGAWHDSVVIRTVKLIPKGPVYLVDRGFYALEVIRKWLKEKVRFIIRVKKRNLVYDILRHVSRPQKVGNLRVRLDAIVRLGGRQAKAHPVVRLVIAILPWGEELILATDRLEWSVERILESYKKRWHIERFHSYIKEALGLAHLYSFHQMGLIFLLYTALLVALLLFLSEKRPKGESIYIFRHTLKTARKELGLGTRWKRNTFTPRRKKTKKKRINL